MSILTLMRHCCRKRAPNYCTRLRFYWLRLPEGVNVFSTRLHAYVSVDLYVCMCMDGDVHVHVHALFGTERMQGFHAIGIGLFCQNTGLIESRWALLYAYRAVW